MSNKKSMEMGIKNANLEPFHSLLNMLEYA